MEGWTNKVWGWFKTVHQDEHCIIQRLNIVQGGYSSKHYHERLNNRMIVLFGTFNIEWYTYPTEPEIKQLLAGQQLYIPRYQSHRFHALTAVQAIEIITVDTGVIDLNDIVRFDEGGVRSG